MSRFSKAAAEKLGWAFTHESDEVVLRDGSDQQGVTKIVPARVTAEKFLSLPGKGAHTITETAETIGLLLERIHLFEQHLESLGLSDAEPPEVPENQLLSREEENARVVFETETLAAGGDVHPEGGRVPEAKEEEQAEEPAPKAKTKRRRRSIRRKKAAK